MASQFLWTSKSVDLLGRGQKLDMAGQSEANALCGEQQNLQGGCSDCGLDERRV